MTDAPADGSPDEGLCRRCLYGRPIRSAKGPTYILCERSLVDQLYPKYPTIPVLHCSGFQELSSRQHPRANR